MKLKQLRVLYPLLLSVYPVLALLASNVEEARVEDGLRALGISVLFACVLLVALRWALKDRHSASLLTAFYLLLFFSYGHLYQALDETLLFGVEIGRHRYFLPAWFLLFGLGMWMVLRRIRDPERITSIASLFSAVAVILPALQLGWFIVSEALGRPEPTGRSSFLESLNAPAPDQVRDVYYLVLDGYSRDDTLKDVFGFDNEEFLIALDNLGFYVAQCSRSNYPKTRISLTSTLNMEYLATLDVTDNEKTKYTSQLIRHSLVRRAFERLGYATAAFETNFYWTEWEDADLFLSRKTPLIESAARQFEVAVLNDFEVLLLRTTMVRAYFDLSRTLFDRLFPESVLTTTALAFEDQPRVAHYERTLFALNTLAELPEMEGPFFVFAHIVSPHWPYVFDREGELVPSRPKGDNTAYIEQVKYLNNRLTGILSLLIERSDPDPIIVIQADHGAPGTQWDPERMKILNAYYLPEGGDEALYASITPVNTFRLIFDTYFGTDLGLLEDISYHSTAEDFFDFTVYPDDRPGCENP